MVKNRKYNRLFESARKEVYIVEQLIPVSEDYAFETIKIFDSLDKAEDYAMFFIEKHPCDQYNVIIDLTKDTYYTSIYDAKTDTWDISDIKGSSIYNYLNAGSHAMRIQPMVIE